MLPWITVVMEAQSSPIRLAPDKARDSSPCSASLA